MSNNPEYRSRALHWHPTKEFKYTEAYKQSQWQEMMKRLEGTQEYAFHRGYTGLDDVNKRKPKRQPHAAQFIDFYHWMRREGYTLAWAEVWKEWRALGDYYQTIPPVDKTFVEKTIESAKKELESIDEPDSFHFKFHPRQSDEPDPFFDLHLDLAISVTVECTYLWHYERNGILDSDTLARIHWMDWMTEEGLKYTNKTIHDVFNYVSIECLENEMYPDDSEQ